MSAIDLLPDSNGATQNWGNGTGTGFGEVNSGVDTPTDGSYIQEDGTNNELHQFGFDNKPADFGSTNSITLKVRHQRNNMVDDTDDFTVQLLDNGTPLGSPQAVTQSDGTPANSSLTDATNWDSLTGAQIDTISIDIVYRKNSTGMPDANRNIQIFEIELVLDYDVAAGGLVEGVGMIPITA
jgi:hypothetical protein